MKSNSDWRPFSPEFCLMAIAECDGQLKVPLCDNLKNQVMKEKADWERRFLDARLKDWDAVLGKERV